MNAMDRTDKAIDSACRGLFGMPMDQAYGLLKAGDYDALTEALNRTMEAEVERAAAIRRLRNWNENRTRAQAETVAPTPYKHITIEGKIGNRRVGYRRQTFYVTGLSFADGPGMAIRKVSFDADVTKAHRFSLATATDVAGKLARSYREVKVVPA